MPRTTLLNLPVEIHFEILKYARYHAQREDYGIFGSSPPRFHPDDDDDDDEYFVGWKWIEEDRRELSQFPYNAAAVCKLWHDVLAKTPECWTRVIIDVATDPSRFLDIFSWSKDLPKLEVTILNSYTPNAQDVDYSSLERKRVSAIADALRPHASRCKSITFDVGFLTSLPSPVIFLRESAPYLEELTLECKVNNAGSPEDYSRTCDIGVRGPIQTPSLFPEFRNLSLTGFWFMFVAGHPYTSEWFKKSAVEKDCSVSHFQFQKEGRYTIRNFISYSSALRPHSITLSDISLNNDVDGPILEGDENDQEEETFPFMESMEFRNVSADVIQSIFLLAIFRPGFLTFDNCALPEEILSSGAHELWLKNIPYSIPAPDSASGEINTNLASILRNWTGFSLNVISCPSFDDEILSILTGYEEGSELVSLYINDCDNFTVRGIRRYLRRRNKRSTEPQDHRLDEPLEHLHIHGGHYSFPSEEDKEWFRTSECAEPIYINWSISNPDTGFQRFLKDQKWED